jgi:hypothetical protein
MAQRYTDDEVRQQLHYVKEAVDRALATEGRGPRRALLAALQESVTRSVGMSERLSDPDISVA